MSYLHNHKCDSIFTYWFQVSTAVCGPSLPPRPPWTLFAPSRSSAGTVLASLSAAVPSSATGSRKIRSNYLFSGHKLPVSTIKNLGIKSSPNFFPPLLTSQKVYLFRFLRCDRFSKYRFVWCLAFSELDTIRELSNVYSAGSSSF